MEERLAWVRKVIEAQQTSDDVEEIVRAIKNDLSEGIKAGLLRPITLWPFPSARILELADTAKAFLSVELSMGQMVSDVKLACECRRPVEFYGRTGGVIPAPGDVARKLAEMAREQM